MSSCIAGVAPGMPDEYWENLRYQMSRSQQLLVLTALILASCAIAACGQKSNWYSYNELGIKASEQGHYDEAEQAFLSAIEELEKLGPPDSSLAGGLSNLAVLYCKRGKYAEAEPLLKRALAINEKTVGSNNPIITRDLNDLAVLYCEQGRYAQAEPLFKRSLAIAEKDSDTRKVAMCLNSLAFFYQRQGKYAEAEPLYKRALTIDEKVFGPNLPDMAMFLHNYATLLRETKRNSEAAKLEARVRAIRAQQK